MKAPQRRRRRKPSATARLRPFWIVIVVVLAILAVGAYLGVTWEGFRPTDVGVEGAHPPVTAQAVRNAAAVDTDQNIWLMHPHRISERVEGIPYVDTASVERGWPNHVTIAVTLRQPAIRLTTARGTFVLDERLRALQGDAPQFAGLPLLRDTKVASPALGATVTAPSVVALSNDEKALAQANVRPDILERDSYGGLTITLHNGVLVKLGEEDDLGKKIALIQPVLEHVSARLRDVRAIDLRAASTPVVEYKK